MKLLIVDDHAMFREGVAAVLRQAHGKALILHAAASKQALALVAEHPDLDAALVDLNLGGASGHIVIRELRRLRPSLPVVVLSSSEDPADVAEAMQCGALGYIPKSADSRTMLSALRFVLAGNVYIPPLLVRPWSSAARAQPAPRLARDASPALTQRQMEVLRLMCAGLPNKEISRKLGLAEKTIKTHVSAIFRALNVVNRTQAAIAARESGLVSGEPLAAA